jgi:hypothetical protein
MTAYVEECRREWKRLGVPDGLAEEMATELESDLAEAEADGVSAAELLGESDPRRFAATWAGERGLVSEQPPRKSRKRLWIWVAVGLAVFVFLILFPALVIGVGSGSTSNHLDGLAIPIRQTIKVPNLVGSKACPAVRTATRVGFFARPHQSGDLPHDAVVDGVGYACDSVVARQRPAPGEIVRPHSRLTLRLAEAKS